MGIFDVRKSFKPFEYPEILEFKDAIRHSYWIHTEWNFVGDIHDFKSLPENEKNAIKNAMLAISQIEIAVKKFWSNLGDRFPKSEFDQVGITFGESECYDDQTEILTDQGWIKFKNLNKSELVAQFDSKNSKIDFVKPKSYFKKNYNGKLHHYKSKLTDIMVTPNHEILVIHPQKDLIEKRKSSEGKWGRNYRYPINGIGTSEKSIKFNDFHKLLIAIQADGSLYGLCPSEKDDRKDVSLSFKKIEKIKRLKILLEKLNIKYTESVRSNKFHVFNFKLNKDINIKEIKNFDWVDIKKVDYDFSRKFIDEISYWDSHVNNENIYFYNTNEKAIDKVQQIAILGKHQADKKINRNKDEISKRLSPDGIKRKNSKTCYFLCINNKTKKTYPVRKEVDYDGEVFCLSVEKNNIIIRRNGIVSISGNCRHSDAYSHLINILGMNDDFNTLLDNPVILGRVDYLNKYIKNASSKENKDFSLVLTLFSIFVENVSLFSQFLVIKAFNKHKNILKDIDNVVQATQQEECYIEGTEVLTPNGWRQIKDMSVGDDVVEYDMGNLNFTKVKHVISKPYDGNMIKFHKQASECIVTPNHDMCYYDVNGVLKKVSAEKFKPHNRKYIPHGGIFSQQGVDELSFEDRLKIVIQADGSVLKWKSLDGEVKNREKNEGFSHQVSVKKHRKVERLSWILDNLNLRYVKKEKEDEYIFNISFYSNEDYKKFNWIDLSDKSSKWCESFLLETVEWDGYRTGFDKSYGYSSTCKENIDKVQLIAILAGYRTGISNDNKSKKTKYKDCYKLSFRKKDILTACHGLKKDIIENYSGEVHCVTVPSGVIVTRYNDKVMIAGNCLHAKFGAYLVNKIKEEYPEWFDKKFESTIKEACLKAYDAEKNIIDWIFEKGELDFLPKSVVIEFTKDRFNQSMNMIGLDPVFDIDEDLVKQTEWFDEEVLSSTNVDFFYKKPTTYSKFTKPINEDDLF